MILFSRLRTAAIIIARISTVALSFYLLQIAEIIIEGGKGKM